MTEQEIKIKAQWAYDHVAELASQGKLDGTFEKIFVLGAHCRDEEIQALNTTIGILNAKIARLNKNLEVMQKWISVEKDLPVDCFPEYLIKTASGDKYFGTFDGEDWYTKDQDGDIKYVDDVTHWAYAPEL